MSMLSMMLASSKGCCVQNKRNTKVCEGDGTSLQTQVAMYHELML